MVELYSVPLLTWHIGDVRALNNTVELYFFSANRIPCQVVGYVNEIRRIGANSCKGGL